MIAFQSTGIYVGTWNKLNTFSDWMKYRFRLYRKIIRKELISIGCTDLSFDIISNSLYTDFKFRGIEFTASIDIDSTESYKYINWFTCDKLKVWRDSDNKSFIIENIKKDLSKKLLDSLIKENLYP